jgi:hypothetical protein
MEQPGCLLLGLAEGSREIIVAQPSFVYKPF